MSLDGSTPHALSGETGEHHLGTSGIQHHLVPAHTTLRFQDLYRQQNNATIRLLNESGLLYTYNGRGAIWQLLLSLKNSTRKTVLIPAFHCPSMVFAAIDAGFSPAYYGIDDNLEIDHEDLLAKLDRHVAAVLTVNYFGFPADLECLKSACKDAGIMLIEDCAHSFYYANPLRLAGERGDAAVFSFRKTLPCGTGGGMRINNPSIHIDIPEARRPLSESLQNLKGLGEEVLANSRYEHLKRAYDRIEGIRTSFGKSAYEEPDKSATQGTSEYLSSYRFHKSHGITRIPWSTQQLLNRACLEDISKQRQANYRTASEIIQETSGLKVLFSQLPKHVVPWCFPVLMDSRSNIDHKLRVRGVPLFTHGETLHPSLLELATTEPDMVARARNISERILCFSIHQNLSESEVSAYCATVNSFNVASS